jgi:hypothetical protein
MLKQLLLTVLCVLAGAPTAAASWSIVAADRSTGTLVVASASCVPQARFANFPARDLMDLQAIVVPGKAVGVAQGTVDASRAQQKLIFDELQKGTAPLDVLLMLHVGPADSKRQFGIVDLQGRSAAFSGLTTQPFSTDKQDKVGDDIFVSVQGSNLPTVESSRSPRKC